MKENGENEEGGGERGEENFLELLQKLLSFIC
jgi:hypothetical protein